MVINNWKPEKNKKFKVYSYLILNENGNYNQSSNYNLYSEDDIKLFNSISKNYELVPIQNLFNNSLEFYMIFKTSSLKNLSNNYTNNNIDFKQNDNNIKQKIKNFFTNFSLF